jgi:diaminohydroxyphosphoribosylaminopyrimidine deaminase/5-amino-6-(5-phosphoribosylamino)uracil reductase
VIDKELKLPQHLRLFDGTVHTIVFNNSKDLQGDTMYIKLSNESNYIPQIMEWLFQLNIQSVLVEGGAQLLQSFIDEDIWDEARIITNNELQVPGGLQAPELKSFKQLYSEEIHSDTIRYFQHV